MYGGVLQTCLGTQFPRKMAMIYFCHPKCIGVLNIFL